MEKSEVQTEAELVKSGMKAALRYLQYRPRSESELKAVLKRGGFDSVSASVLDKLRNGGLVDDFAFARFWSENRLSFRPRSKRLIGQEMRQKGVDEQVVRSVIQGIDDEASAASAGRKKARLLGCNDYDDFRHILTTYLKARGFSYDVINSVVPKLWRERSNVIASQVSADS